MYNYFNKLFPKPEEYFKGGQNFGDSIVPLDGNENKTEIVININDNFSAIVTDNSKKKVLGCRVVPNDGFIKKFGAKAAVSVEKYLNDVTEKSKNEPVTYVSLILLGKKDPPKYLVKNKDNSEEKCLENIHLAWFYSLAANTSDENLNDLFEDFKVPKEIFKSIAAKTLYKMLELGRLLRYFNDSDIIGLEADGKVQGSLINEEGENDRSFLAKYYQKLGFHICKEQHKYNVRNNLPIFEEIPMTGNFLDVLNNLSKL